MSDEAGPQARFTCRNPSTVNVNLELKSVGKDERIRSRHTPETLTTTRIDL